MNTKNKTKNEIYYWVNFALFNTALLMINGSIIQSFMLESGMAESQVSFYVSIANLAQIMAMVTCSWVMDRLKNIIRTGAFMQLACLPMFVLLIIFCINIQMPIGLKFVCILIVGSIANVAMGLQSITNSKLPFEILDMKRYGIVLAIAGIVQGVLGITVSYFITFATEKGSYFSVMKGFFGLGTVMVFIGALAQLCMKKSNTLPHQEMTKKKIKLFRYRPFYILAIPNFFRGFSAGIFNLAVTIGYWFKIIDEVSAGYMFIIYNVVSLVSCVFYYFFSKRCADGNGKLMLVCGILTLLFPAMLLNESVTVYLIVYTVMNFVFSFSGNASLVIVSRVVHYEVIGRYSAWKVLLTMMGNMTAGFVCITMLEHLGGYMTLGIAGVMNLISGAVYYFVNNKACIRNSD